MLLRIFVFANSMFFLRSFILIFIVSLIPNFSHILTSSPYVQVGKDCLSPMQRPVSSIFDDWCNCSAVLEIGNYLNDEHICFAGRKGCMVLDIKVELQVKLHFVSE